MRKYVLSKGKFQMGFSHQEFHTKGLVVIVVNPLNNLYFKDLRVGLED